MMRESSGHSGHWPDRGSTNEAPAAFVERVVQESLGQELSQALVMIYCRHLARPGARATLRRMAADEATLLRQFDALDQLHDEHPFTPQDHQPLLDELMLLYRHNAQQGVRTTLCQLRLLCRDDQVLLRAFERLDTEFDVKARG